MKVIFLDIDGVLNCKNSKSRCQGLIGVDRDKVKRLRKIVDETDAKIVLCSTWKMDWERVNKEDQNHHGKYLDKKLKSESLYILDKTTDRGSNRGEGIANWIERHKIDQWIVLDDEVFEDYKEYDVFAHLVKTNFYEEDGGLKDEHVIQAIKLLGGKL